MNIIIKLKKLTNDCSGLCFKCKNLTKRNDKNKDKLFYICINENCNYIIYVYIVFNRIQLIKNVMKK